MTEEGKNIRKVRARRSYHLFKILVEAGLTDKQMKLVSAVLNEKHCWGSRTNACYAEESLVQVLKDRTEGIINSNII
jgi:5-bromo-4-chloroindolyl phosphate hydrolysis protein